MHDEAKQAEERATKVAGEFEGKKTAILDEAREVKQKATEMMQDYLDRDADALDGFEFLTMAEAGEVGHWEILKTLNERARNSGVQEPRRVGNPDPAAPPRAGPAGFPEACSGGRPERNVLSWARPWRSRSVSPVAGAAPSIESPRNRSFLRRLRRHWRPGVTRSHRRSPAAISVGL